MTTTTDNGPRRLFDIPSAAAYLISIGATAATPTFIRTLISRGEIPHVKISKRFFVSRDALDSRSHLDARSIKTGPNRTS